MPVVKGDDAAGGAAVLDGIAGGFGVDGADRVGADAEVEGAEDGRADVEAVEGVEGHQVSDPATWTWPEESAMTPGLKGRRLRISMLVG